MPALCLTKQISQTFIAYVFFDEAWFYFMWYSYTEMASRNTTEAVAWKCSVKTILCDICKIHRKTPVPLSLFASTGIFLLILQIFHRTLPFLEKTTGRLLLKLLIKKLTHFVPIFLFTATLFRILQQFQKIKG